MTIRTGHPLLVTGISGQTGTSGRRADLAALGCPVLMGCHMSGEMVSLPKVLAAYVASEPVTFLFPLKTVNKQREM